MRFRLRLGLAVDTCLLLAVVGEPTKLRGAAATSSKALFCCCFLFLFYFFNFTLCRYLIDSKSTSGDVVNL